MAPGVVVDLAQLGRLASAARSTADALAQLASTLATGGPSGSCGDTDPALRAFRARWGAEATLAAGAAAEFADGLGGSAAAYRAADEAALRRMRVS